MRSWILLAVPLLAAAGRFTELRAADANQPWANAAVAADHPLASQAGVEILREGGNVVDAAVATGFAQSVLRPGSSGLGGGGFMVIWNADSKTAITLDYRERAPLSATRDMFLLKNDRQHKASSRFGPHAVAVPGHVAGLCQALRKYGTMSLRKVLGPAIRLAQDGVLLDEHEREVRQSIRQRVKTLAKQGMTFETLNRRYLLDDQPLTAETRFRSPQLAALSLIAEHGPDAFYKGRIAESIVRTVTDGGGILSAADLATMDVVERKPLICEFGEATIITMPPPSSGGVALIEVLNLLQSVESQQLGERRIETLGRHSPAFLHVLTESMKHAFADRAAYLGDADFADVPVERLISRDYAASLAMQIQLDQTRPLRAYGRFQPVDDAGTTHFSVIDRHGNAVACTETINTSFGSLLVEPHFGIVLNNEMDDFSAEPGKPNAFGLIQSEANCVEPRKKPLSSMTPTIVVREGRAVMALGASGGPRIISATLQVLLNRLRFRMPVGKAVDEARIHHQWLPETLYVEDQLGDAVRQKLQSRGHSIKTRSDIGVCQAVVRTASGIQARSDPRKHGRAAGY